MGRGAAWGCAAVTASRQRLECACMVRLGRGGLGVGLGRDAAWIEFGKREMEAERDDLGWDDEETWVCVGALARKVSQISGVERVGWSGESGK